MRYIVFYYCLTYGWDYLEKTNARRLQFLFALLERAKKNIHLKE